jgi:hypothetical protein
MVHTLPFCPEYVGNFKNGVVVDVRYHCARNETVTALSCLILSPQPTLQAQRITSFFCSRSLNSRTYKKIGADPTGIVMESRIVV